MMVIGMIKTILFVNILLPNSVSERMLNSMQYFFISSLQYYWVVLAFLHFIDGEKESM